MPDTVLDLSRPFFLVKIMDKDTGDLKFIWSPNIFLDSERPDDDSTIAPGTYVEDIEIKSNFHPPINTGEVKIDHSVGKTPKIAMRDTLNIYFGYYTLDNSNNAVYTLVYTGLIDYVKASLNHTTIKASSRIRKLTDFNRDLTFSRIMTISDIIQKLAIDDGGLESAPNGITTTNVSKQKGYAISKNLSIYKHLKKLADLVNFDIYMDPFDKFNARVWMPEPAPVQTGPSGIPTAMGWLSARGESETEVQNQLIHPIFFGVNAIDMDVNIKKRGPSNIEITTLADCEAEEIFTIEPPMGSSGGNNGGGGSSGGSTGEESEFLQDKIVLPRFTRDDADKIAQAIARQNDSGLTGSLTILGSPQIRLGDGVQIKGHIFGKKPFSRIDAPSSEWDASFSTDQETKEEGGEQSSQGSSAEEKIFKITGIKHLFNDSLGFITKLNVMEAVPVSPEELAAMGAEAEGAEVSGITTTETEFTGVAREITAEGELIEGPINVINLSWNADAARRDETLNLTADVSGVEDGTNAVIEIYEYDADGEHDFIKKIETTVKDSKINVKWDYEYTEDTDEIPTEEESEKGYNPPEYFFVIELEGERFGDENEPGLLEFKDYIELKITDEDGDPIPDLEFILYLPDKSEIKGKLNSEGYAKVDNVPPGKYFVEFPGLISLNPTESEKKSE